VQTITYPDGEVVGYGYDHAGQVTGMTGSDQAGAPATYLSTMTYDLLGRPGEIDHGNGITDVHLYYGADENFRLGVISSLTGLALFYGNYQANGLLTRIFDASGSPDPLSNTATYTYDGLGRLTGVNGNVAMNSTYAYTDHLGNLTMKDGVPLTYSSAKPHQLTNTGALGGSVSYDANGNRSGQQRASNASAVYSYDLDDHLRSVTGSYSVQFAYDYTGRRVAQYTGAGAWAVSTLYYSDFQGGGRWYFWYVP
jgi:YD repeat-containing protein